MLIMRFLELETFLYSPRINYFENLKSVIEYAKDRLAQYISKLPEYSKIGYEKIKKYLDKIPIHIFKLPSIVFYTPTKILIGKILGAYNPQKNEIYLDKSLLLNLKNFLKGLYEELAHAVQNLAGKLKIYRNSKEYLQNYENDENEKEAKRIATELVNQDSKYLLENFYSSIKLVFDKLERKNWNLLSYIKNINPKKYIVILIFPLSYLYKFEL